MKTNEISVIAFVAWRERSINKRQEKHFIETFLLNHELFKDRFDISMGG